MSVDGKEAGHSHSNRDLSSLSNAHEVYATHAVLDLNVDFDSEVISGSVTYRVTEKTPPNHSSMIRTLSRNSQRNLAGAGGDGNGGGEGGSNEEDAAPRLFVVDTVDLIIKRVEVDGRPAKFVMRPVDPTFGTALEVHLPMVFQDQCSVKITYRTTPSSTAVQWLPPAQTAGKERPYVFTQSQAIHARSLLPCQDSPSVKITYEARVRVPGWATCLMSALAGEVYGQSDGSKVYTYHQPLPLPSYLIALAVGDLSSRDLSHRCRIWAEPSVVEAAAFDFSQTEEFLQAAEELAGEYQWGRYDVLCLPPSFPYGGMENPCLTFVTPTLLAGDKSLAFVVAHEISHSWTGNLITNLTWEHFWLNEGWTMVTKEPLYFDFDAQIGWKHLQDDVALFNKNGNGALTALVPPLEGVDPDDAFSSVPYEKGFSLLYSLEQRVGTPEFEAFALAYIAKFKYLTITSNLFKDFVNEYFTALSPEASAAIAGFDWDTWLYKPGMPSSKPRYDDSLCRESWELADTWLACVEAGGGEEQQLEDVKQQPEDVKQQLFEGWPSPQKVLFLERLLLKTGEEEEGEGGEGGSVGPLPLPVLSAIDTAYALSRSTNSELRFRWYQLSLRSGQWDIVPQVVDFLTSMGRMKFVRPLYRALKAHPHTEQLAIDTFMEHASFYHPIARGMVEKDLGVTAPVAAQSKAKAAGASGGGGGGGGKEGEGSEDGSNKDSWLVVLGVGVVAAAAAAAIALRALRGR